MSEYMLLKKTKTTKPNLEDTVQFLLPYFHIFQYWPKVDTSSFFNANSDMRRTLRCTQE